MRRNSYTPPWNWFVADFVTVRVNRIPSLTWGASAKQHHKPISWDRRNDEAEPPAAMGRHAPVPFDSADVISVQNSARNANWTCLGVVAACTDVTRPKSPLPLTPCGALKFV